MKTCTDKIDNRKEANAIINSLKICDPAVGSGHFLVSALNELIAIKHDLKILEDRQGRRLKEYQVEVVNDELVITDEEGKLFEYHPGSTGSPKATESQRVQEALFHEKQTIIEHCLFGVDINANSVKICRLRLWIELLKNAYYVSHDLNRRPSESLGQAEAALETLPNIDINIKCGNSLVSRFKLDADLKQALKKSKYSIDGYRAAVDTYRNAESKEEKREMERLMAAIKADFRSEISLNDPLVKKLQKVRGELLQLTTTQSLFELAKKEKAAWNKKVEQLSGETKKLEAEIDAIKANKIFEHAFEWRFEFPEVLNDDGDFIGFDVVIGNPPYIRQEELSWMKPYLQSNYNTYVGTADLYVFFVEKGMMLLKQEGQFCYILPNKWMKGGYGKALRQWVAAKQTLQMVDFGDLPVFEEATTYPSIWQMQNSTAKAAGFKAAVVEHLDFAEGMTAYLNSRWLQVSETSLTPDSWNLVDGRLQQLLDKIKAAGKPLGEYVEGRIYRGVLTGYNEAFVIDDITRQRLIDEDSKSADIIKPFLAGRDIKRYQQPQSDKWLIFTRRGINIDNYTAVLNHLLQFKEKLDPKPKSYTKNDWAGRKAGTYKWYEIQDAVDYYYEFESPKILYQEIAAYSTFTFDTKGLYCNNKLFLIPSENPALLGFLNSKLTWFCLQNSANILRGALALQSPYILTLSLHPGVMKNALLNNLVIQILDLKYQDEKADTSLLETEINRITYQLYNLTEEEIKIIETHE